MNAERRTRLLLVDTQRDAISEAHVDALPALLDARDVLVVNDAATLPASLAARTADGSDIEVRLLEAPYRRTTQAVLFGPGDYHIPTESRLPPPALAVGAAIYVGAATLEVAAVSARSPRLIELRWPAGRSARFSLLYSAGRPVQYSYVEQPLALWDVQTAFAGRPWAVEMPSAARPLRGAILLDLRARGVTIVSLTHAAGLSATGDRRIDEALPLPERYELPELTVRTVQRTRERGGRVVAVGTSVVRALEDSFRRNGALVPGPQTAELVLDHTTDPRVVSGLLTGIHMPGESHYRLLSAFARPDTLSRAAQLARAEHYRLHEFGDAALFLPGLSSAQRRVA
jgi:S-adenosylmethionine:tRNA ribosyltransferase-isomerase